MGGAGDGIWLQRQGHSALRHFRTSLHAGCSSGHFPVLEQQRARPATSGRSALRDASAICRGAARVYDAILFADPQARGVALHAGQCARERASGLHAGLARHRRPRRGLPTARLPDGATHLDAKLHDAVPRKPRAVRPQEPGHADPGRWAAGVDDARARSQAVQSNAPTPPGVILARATRAGSSGNRRA